MNGMQTRNSYQLFWCNSSFVYLVRSCEIIDTSWLEAWSITPKLYKKRANVSLRSAISSATHIQS